MFSPWIALGLVLLVAVGNLALGYFAARWLLLPPRRVVQPAPVAIVKPKGTKSAAEDLADEEAAALAADPRMTSSLTEEREDAGPAGLAPAITPIVAIAQFRDALLANRQQMLVLDEQLRAQRLNPPVDLVAEASGAIRQVVRGFVAAREALTSQLPAAQSASVAAAARREMLQAADARTLDSAAMLALLAEIKSQDSTPHAAIERLLEEVGKLIHRDGRMVELIEDVLLLTAREEGVLARLPAGVGRGLGEPCGLLGLASHMAREEEENTSAGPLSFIEWDVDGTAALNEEWGPAVVERVLLGLGGMIEQIAPEDAMLARISGQRYVLLAPVGGERAAAISERVRQTLEISPVEVDGEQIELTLSAGVVERKPGERFEAMRERATAALSEAKQYGRNRTFLQEGEYPTPVLPPELSVAPLAWEAATLVV